MNTIYFDNAATTRIRSEVLNEMMPYYNQNNDIYMISYVIPLYYNNEFFGVVGMDFDYTVLIDKVHNMKIYENGFAHLEYEGTVLHNENHHNEIAVYENPEEKLCLNPCQLYTRRPRKIYGRFRA